MAEPGRPTVTLAELNRLAEADRTTATRLTGEQIYDVAIASLVVMRNLQRSDKRRVLTALKRLVG